MSQVKEMIEIKAGEKLELFSRSFSSVPMNYEFSAEPMGQCELNGTLEIHRQRSLAKKSVTSSRLQQKNSVRASMWDTFVTIYVVAEEDLKVTVPKRQLASLKLMVGLTVLLVAIASVMMIRL